MRKLILLAATALATPAFAATAPSFSIASATAAENTGTISFTITKAGTTRRKSTLSFSTANVTAHSGSDYVAKSVNVVFAASQTTATVDVTLVNDSNAEGTETFLASIHAGSNARILTGNATGTITDSDSIPAPVATQVCWDGSIIPATSSCPAVPPPPPPPPPSPPPAFSVGDVTVNESAGAATVTVTKTGANGSSSTLTYATSNGSATAGSDYTSTSGTLAVPAGVTISTITIPIINSVTTEPTETFNLVITPVTNASTADHVGVVTIIDSVPAPSPGAGGATFVDNGDNRTLAYAAIPGGTIPPSGAPDVVGAFRFICTAGQVLADDPILFPGQPGASHLHQFYGNTSATGNSTYTSLSNTGQSTCNRGVTVPANRSAYWMPALLNGLGYVVKPDYVSIYYKERPPTDPTVTDPTNPRYEGHAVPIPNGLRFIFGWDPTGVNSARTGAAYFNCDGPSAVPGHYNDLPTALANCPAGNRVGAIIEAPECWDGVNLDTPDHRSHVGYATYGGWGYLKCDSAHPYVIPTFQLAAWYSIVAGDNTSLWSLSSDAMVTGQPKGYTFHADYFEAWFPTVKAMWQNNCVNLLLNCSAGDLGNGQRLVGAAVNGNASPRLVPVP